MKFVKAITIFLYVLLGAGALIGILFYTEVISEELLIDLAYVYFGIAAVLSIGFPIYQMITNPKGAVNTFIGLGIMAVIVLIAYALASDQVMHMVGYSGPDNTPSMQKAVGTGLITTYILFLLAITSIIVTEIYNSLK